MNNRERNRNFVLGCIGKYTPEDVLITELHLRPTKDYPPALSNNPVTIIRATKNLDRHMKNRIIDCFQEPVSYKLQTRTKLAFVHTALIRIYGKTKAYRVFTKMLQYAKPITGNYLASQALSCTFSWHFTREGDKYWRQVFNDLQKEGL